MGDIANDVICARDGCGHLASGHEDVDAGENSGPCTMQGCNCSAMQVAGDGASTDGDARADGDAANLTARIDGDRVALYVGERFVGYARTDLADRGATVFGAIPPHETDTTDGEYDAADHVGRIADGDTEALRGAHAHVDDNADPATKDAYSLPHHEVGDDGKPGAANTTAASNAIAALNGARGGSNVPDDQRQAVHDHLAAHLADAGKDAPPLKPPAGGGDGASADGDAFAEGDAAPVPDGVGDDPDETAVRFRMPVMVLEGIDTGDGRHIAGQALTTRDLPIPLMAITKTTFGHEDAELVGRIETAERFDASGLTNPKTGEPYGNAPDGQPVYAWRGEGTFTSLENAQTVSQLVEDGFLRGISVDLSDVTSILEILDEDGNAIDDDEVGIEILFMDGDIRETVTEGRIMGATVCPFPAFEGAYIEIDDGPATPADGGSEPVPDDAARVASIHVLDQPGARTCAPCEDGVPLVASAGPVAPPTSWFDDPALDGPTPLTVTEDGRIFGHLATWGTCHTGHPGRCVTAPHSATNYGYFHTGSLLTAEGDTISVGQITLGTGHADLALARGATVEHYDNTGTAAADVRVGEDSHGIWVAGATRPDITPAQVRALRAAALSGDWRAVGRNLELVAALAVNVPGFPVVRALAASGATTALVAAGGRGVIRAAFDARNALSSLLAWKDSVEPLLLDARAEQLARRVRS